MKKHLSEFSEKPVLHFEVLRDDRPLGAYEREIAGTAVFVKGVLCDGIAQLCLRSSQVGWSFMAWT